MNTPQDVADRIIKVARKHDTDVQEAIVTNLGLEPSGLIQVQLKDSPIHVRATGVEQLAVGDAIFVKRLTGDQWSIWHYAGFSHRGDVDPSSPFYWVPRVPQIMDNGTLLPTRKITNFIGATVADNPALRSTDITVGDNSLIRCSAYGGRTPFPGGSFTNVPIDTADFDSHGMFNPTAHVITVLEEGDYLMHAFISWSPAGDTDPTTGTYRQLSIHDGPSGGPYSSREYIQSPPRDSGARYYGAYSQDTTYFKHLLQYSHIALNVAHDATGDMQILGPTTAVGNPGQWARLSVIKLG